MANLNSNPNGTSNLTNWSAVNSTITSTADGVRWIGTASTSGRYLQIKIPAAKFSGMEVCSVGGVQIRRNSGTALPGSIKFINGGNPAVDAGSAAPYAFPTGVFVRVPSGPLVYTSFTPQDSYIRIYVGSGAFNFTVKGVGLYAPYTSAPADPTISAGSAAFTTTQSDNSLKVTASWTPSAGPIDTLAWQWGGEGTESGAATSSAFTTRAHTFAARGIYPIKLTASYSSPHPGGGSGSANTTKTVTVPAGTFQAGYAYETDWLSVAVDAASSITPSLDPIDTYAWDWGDGSSTAANPSKLASHTFAAPGGYNVTLTTHTNATNRTATHTKTITVLSPPSTGLSFTASKQLLTVAFIPSVLDGTSYAWDFGDGNTSTETSPTHVYASPGTYTVTLVVDALDPATQTVTVTDVYTPLGSLMDALRLEVAIPKTGVRNLLPNPSGDLGAWGWWTSATNSYLTGSVTADQPADKGVLGAKLIYRSSGSGHQIVRSAAVRAVAGQYAAVQVNVPFVEGYYRIALDAMNAAGAVVGTSSWSGYQTAHTTNVVRSGPYLLPAGTVSARVALWHTSNTSTGVPTVNKLLIFRRAMLALAGTSGELTSIPYSEGQDWQDLIGPTSEISITRDALNLGTLSATILDSTFDPATSGTIRPKQTCRLRVKTPDEAGNVRWQPIFTGSVGDPEVEYVPAKGIADSPKLTRIKLTAYDAVRTLAQWERGEGVAKIKELPEILEGVPVPYEVNGSTGQVPSASIVNANENASVLDQVAITRDSDGGYAFVDRAGVLIVCEPEFMPATPVGVIDEAVYSGINAGFKLADVINSVKIKWLRYIPAAGDEPAKVEEVVYGPYEDNESIDEWDIRPATFTMLGVENPTNIAARAAEILTANKQPVRMITGVTVPIRFLEDLAPGKALIDLYDLVRLGYQRTGTDQQIRVTSIKHTITPKSWLMDLGFSADGATASPQAVAAPPVAVPDYTPYDSGWITVGTTGAPAFTNGFQEYSAGGVKYRRVGEVVQLGGALKPNTATAQVDSTSNGANPAFTLPAGFRPPVPQVVLCQGSGRAAWMIQVSADGGVSACRYREGTTNGGSAAGTWLPFSLTFFAA